MGLLDIFRSKQPSHLPKGKLLIAIGDIHGDLNELNRLLGEIQNRLNGSVEYHDKEVIFLGDYVDRGPSSKEVIDYLIADDFLHDWKKTYLAGNHELLLLKAYEEEDYVVWLRSAGGRETISSYGVKVTDDSSSFAETEEMLRAFRRAFPDQHLNFMKSMPYSYTTGPYFFVHAGVNPKIKLEHQTKEDLLWIRKPFLSSKKDFGKIIVHGHTPTQHPERHNNRISVDTGCGRGGYLSCAVLFDDKIEFIT